MSDTRNTTIVAGAGRGLGRGIAEALADAGVAVVAVARSEAPLLDLAEQSVGITPAVADAAAPGTAVELIERHGPHALIIGAGATPPIAPLQEQTWEGFSINWHTDVRIAFAWLRAALAAPLRPGSRVVVVSSGAALAGSPLSGGYAGAKATQRFIVDYAREEASRASLGIAFTTVLPRITPMTALGRPAIEAYAARGGKTVEEYVRQFGEPLTPQVAGAAVLELLRADAGDLAPSYLLSGSGLERLG